MKLSKTRNFFRNPESALTFLRRQYDMSNKGTLNYEVDFSGFSLEQLQSEIDRLKPVYFKYKEAVQWLMQHITNADYTEFSLPLSARDKNLIPCIHVFALNQIKFFETLIWRLRRRIDELS